MRWDKCLDVGPVRNQPAWPPLTNSISLSHTCTRTYKYINEHAHINNNKTKTTVDYACQNRFSSYHKSFKQRRQKKRSSKKYKHTTKKQEWVGFFLKMQWPKSHLPGKLKPLQNNRQRHFHFAPECWWSQCRHFSILFAARRGLVKAITDDITGCLDALHPV